jgi:hypothetical protein
MAGGLALESLLMSNGKIFLVGDGPQDLRVMTEAAYVKESELQRLLAQYADLLPGDQIDPEDPRRWLFIGREVGIPAAAGEGDWWSLDHLFIDHDGIPTFVECKRASDSRTRREVVAQMLDYAANGTEYWAVDRLRQAGEATAQRLGQSLDERVAQFLGLSAGEPIEQFWARVEENLRAGRVRLIFVVEEAPKELRRMTEFLNGQMKDTEVLLVEIKQFKSEKGERALVPRLIGQTERARATRAASAGTISPAVFLERCDPEVRTFFQGIFKDAQDAGHVISWGTVGFSVRIRRPDGSLSSFAYGYPPNKFEFYFPGWLVDHPDASVMRQEFLAPGLLREAGERTLRVELRASDLDTARDVWQRIVDRMRRPLQ